LISGGRTCRTVTQRVGNMVTTHTECSWSSHSCLLRHYHSLTSAIWKVQDDVPYMDWWRHWSHHSYL